MGQKAGTKNVPKTIFFFLGGGILFKTYQGIDHNNSTNVSFIKIAQLEVGQIEETEIRENGQNLVFLRGGAKF